MEAWAVRPIRRPEDVDELLAPERPRPVLIFKHSTT
ncbi:thioredoxin family protein [Caldinitratiruptor microaerophilus]|nr:thioredoxin family protein [Caldinitratiruptor microaerophilus]